jgi:hypothetical protein
MKLKIFVLSALIGYAIAIPAPVPSDARMRELQVSLYFECLVIALTLLTVER